MRPWAVAMQWRWGVLRLFFDSIRACCSYVMIFGAVEEVAEEAQISNASRVFQKKGGYFWRAPFFFLFSMTNLIFCEFAPLAPLPVMLVT